MVKNCIYCKESIDENSVLDVCKRCGIGVWGEKMFSAILQNMEGAKEAGDLFQGSISTNPSTENQKKTPTHQPSSLPTQPQQGKLNSLLEEAMETQKKVNAQSLIENDNQLQEVF